MFCTRPANQSQIKAHSSRSIFIRIAIISLSSVTPQPALFRRQTTVNIISIIFSTTTPSLRPIQASSNGEGVQNVIGISSTDCDQLKSTTPRVRSRKEKRHPLSLKFPFISLPGHLQHHILVGSFRRDECPCRPAGSVAIPSWHR